MRFRQVARKSAPSNFARGQPVCKAVRKALARKVAPRVVTRYRGPLGGPVGGGTVTYRGPGKPLALMPRTRQPEQLFNFCVLNQDTGLYAIKWHDRANRVWYRLYALPEERSAVYAAETPPDNAITKFYIWAAEANQVTDNPVTLRAFSDEWFWTAGHAPNADSGDTLVTLRTRDGNASMRWHVRAPLPLTHRPSEETLGEEEQEATSEEEDSQDSGSSDEEESEHWGSSDDESEESGSEDEASEPGAPTDTASSKRIREDSADNPIKKARPEEAVVNETAPGEVDE